VDGSNTSRIVSMLTNSRLEISNSFGPEDQR
jgi:hypothetical protein